MRRGLAAAALAAMLFLCACDTGAGLNLRLFCERFNRVSEGRAGISIEQFTAEQSENGMTYTAYVGLSEYVACEAGPNGRLHTVSLTGLPDEQQSGFYSSALYLLKAFTNLAGDEAERVLADLQAGASPVLGMQTLEREGWRASYAANEAGRYFRVSSIRDLPAERELATLRETIAE